VFLTADSAKPHVDAGIKKVVFSAPAKDDSPTIVMGVNDNEYVSDHRKIDYIEWIYD